MKCNVEAKVITKHQPTTTLLYNCRFRRFNKYQIISLLPSKNIQHKMNESKRVAKEKNIILSAEHVFGEVGFKNAKMDEIASHAGITKVTLYSYFHSKENLYMAITYRALQQLNDMYYEKLDKNKSKTGLESVLDILQGFMNFCQDNFLYSEALLDYFALVRSTDDGKNHLKLTEAIKESMYYMKLQDIQNLPFKLTAKEIQRGQKDGSIALHVDPMMYTLFGWSSIIGYIKVLASSGNNASLLSVNLKELQHLNLSMVKVALGSDALKEAMQEMHV